jgi:hypothetical protein
MNRAGCFTLLLAIVAALPAAADDAKFRAAVRDAVVKETQERKEANDRKSQDEQDLSAAANAGNRPARKPHAVSWIGSDDSLRIATCPMGTAGAPTFDEVRNYYRNFTDNEMWKICVNRGSYRGGIPGACACSLLAYPDPWRPVDVPHAMERDDAPPVEVDETGIEVVSEEPAGANSNPEAASSEK